MTTVRDFVAEIECLEANTTAFLREFSETFDGPEFAAAPPARKNCKKGIWCQKGTGKGSCISALKVCAQPVSAQTSAKVSAAQAAVTGGSAPAATAKKRQPKAKTAAATPTPQPAATPTAATTPTPTVPTNQKGLTRSRADLVKRVGQATVEAAEKNVQKVLDKADVFVRVGSSGTLEQILGDRFKTAHELGRTDHQIPYLKDDYLTARARVEAESMGIDKKTAAADRPIYAYMGSSNLNGRSHADVATAYGSIAIKLKPQVKDRTTFTGADSFKSGHASQVKNDGNPPPPNAASLVPTTRHGYDRNKLPSHYPSYYADDDLDGSFLSNAAKAKSIDDLAPALAPTGNAYVEAQVHGKVGPQDIAEIHFEPKGVGDRPTPAIAKFAKDNGVGLFVSGKKLSSKELDSIITPPKDKRTARVRDLNDALASRNFSKVVDLAEQLQADAKNVRLNSGERDRTLKLLRQEAGYSDQPTIGSEKDVTDAWKNGGVLMVRGDASAGKLKGADILKQFQTGDFHTGNGIYGNGTYVGATKYKAATHQQDANDIFTNVAKHGYIGPKTTITRMALKDPVIAKQSDLMTQASILNKQLDAWGQAEKAKIAASGSPYTAQDISNFQAKVSGIKAAYGKAQMTRIQIGKPVKKNGGMESHQDEDWEFPSKNGGDPLIRLRVKAIENLINGSVFYKISDEDGFEIDSFREASGNIRKIGIQNIRDKAILNQARRALGLKDIPSVGNLKDPATQKRLQALDEKIDSVKKTLGLEMDQDGGSIERFAVLQGVDVIALDRSYQPDVFANLLNRSKVVVQKDPLTWAKASKTGAL